MGESTSRCHHADNNPVSFTDPTGLTLDGGGSYSVNSVIETAPPTPTKRGEEFKDGFKKGAGEGVKEIVDSLNPEKVFDNLKNAAGEFLKNPIKALWSFAKAVVTSFAHIDELKGMWDAYQDDDWRRLGELMGKFVIEVGGQVAATLFGGSAVVGLFRKAAKDFRRSRERGETDTISVYRVESPSNERLDIGANGNVSIVGDNVLFLNFGDLPRAQVFLAQRLAQGYDGTRIKSFDIYASYYHDLVARSVPERFAAGNSVFQVDTAKTGRSYGLRSSEFSNLKCGMVPGSGC